MVFEPRSSEHGSQGPALAPRWVVSEPEEPACRPAAQSRDGQVTKQSCTPCVALVLSPLCSSPSRKHSKFSGSYQLQTTTTM